jgi:hypothetical protein
VGTRNLKGADDEVANYSFGTSEGVYSLSVTVSDEGVTTQIIREAGNNGDRFCLCLMNQNLSRPQQTIRIANCPPTRARCSGSQFHV